MNGRRRAVAAFCLAGLCVAGATGAQSDTFEAASINPVSFDRGVPIDFRFLPGRFIATALTLGQLIEQAYGIEAREVIGGPAWLRVDRFNVTATAGENVTTARMRQMLQSLLADRFQLQVAREVRIGTVYTLTARTVRNLNSPADPGRLPIVLHVRENRNGFLSYHFDGHNATMGTLVRVLSQQLGAPVLDATELTGNYDFRINWAYDFAFGGLEPDPDVPTIFTALENEVGLKLVAGSGPVPVYVVTRASKPTPN